MGCILGALFYCQHGGTAKEDEKPGSLLSCVLPHSTISPTWLIWVRIHLFVFVWGRGGHNGPTLHPSDKDTCCVMPKHPTYLLRKMLSVTSKVKLSLPSLWMYCLDLHSYRVSTLDRCEVDRLYTPLSPNMIVWLRCQTLYKSCLCSKSFNSVNRQRKVFM